MVARDRDRVELGHELRSEGEDVADDAHRELRRINIGITHHELLEDVVLDGTGHLFEFHALLQTGHDVEGHDREDGAVHRHRDGHLAERNLVEEDFHILDGADGHTGLAHVAHHARVVGVVAAVRSQVEGHGEAFLTGGQVAAIEGVGFFSRGETGVLADGPGLVDVHRGVRSAEERGHAGGVVQVFHPFEVGGRIKRLHVDLFRRVPEFVLFRGCTGALGRGALGIVDIVEFRSH